MKEYEAGRELDALIAEKIFRWPPTRVTDRGVPGYEPGDVVPQVPRYSTDIGAAWEVVEKLTASGYEACIDFDSQGDWSVIFTKDGDGIWCSVRKNAPLAICLASLKALDREQVT